MSVRSSLQEMLDVYWGAGDGQDPAPACVQNALSALARTDDREVVQVARAAIAYIDAIPKEIVAAFPAMPGFDRDWAEEVIAKASEQAEQK